MRPNLAFRGAEGKPRLPSAQPSASSTGEQEMSQPLTGSLISLLPFSHLQKRGWDMSSPENTRNWTPKPGPWLWSWGRGAQQAPGTGRAGSPPGGPEGGAGEPTPPPPLHSAAVLRGGASDCGLAEGAGVGVREGAGAWRRGAPCGGPRRLHAEHRETRQDRRAWVEGDGVGGSRTR